MANQDHPSGNPSIFILEDNENLRNMIIAALETFCPSANLHYAGTIAEAQELVAELDIDLFLLDIHLPDGTGLDFLCDLRTIQSNASAIVMTATPLAKYREQAFALGVVHFLEKPFDLAALQHEINQLLRQRTSGNAQAPERFAGTLRDLHLTDIIQIKCLGGSTSLLEFTSPKGEKGVIFFEKGQVRHARTADVEGVAAFNRIIQWQSGSFTELQSVGPVPRTIDGDWQMVLMHAVKEADELSGKEAADLLEL